MAPADQDTPEAHSFGWSELIAAALAVGLAVMAMPSPAASSTLDDEDWNFLWVKPTDTPAIDDGMPINVTGSVNLALQPLTDNAPADRTVSFMGAETQSSSGFSHRIAVMPIGARTAPSVSGPQSLQPGITLREDQWTMMDVDGLVRLTAYARGPLEYDDMTQLRTQTSFPRGLGTGVGLVTSTPIYVGAAVKTDRSIYDIDADRFDGARWSTSVFMGAETNFGPLYLGTTKDASGTRSAYLYLGRWF